MTGTKTAPQGTSVMTESKAPKCGGCSYPLPLRAINITVRACWKCGKEIRVATGERAGQDMDADIFTQEELDYAARNGVKFELRMSESIQHRYTANVCPECDQTQGNWFLYDSPQHRDAYREMVAQRKTYGPCSYCAVRICPTHGVYLDYTGETECPSCREVAAGFPPMLQAHNEFLPLPERD